MTVAAVPPFATPVVTPRVRVSVARDDSETSVQYRVVRRRVGAGYFSTLGIPIVRGRDFDERDQRDTDIDASERIEIPVVLNQTAMRGFFGDGNPIGRRIRTSDETFVVVGVAQDVQSAFFSTEPVPTLFWPTTGASFARGSTRGTTIVLKGSREATSFPRSAGKWRRGIRASPCSTCEPWTIRSTVSA